MLKTCVACVALILGLAVLAPSALAQPRNDDAPPPQRYGSEDQPRIRQEMDRRAPDANATAPAPERATYPERPAGYADTGSRDCANCPPPKHYDSTEVIKNSRDVDHSRVINTESVIEVPPRTKETNKLIVHENETRNVGVIQHNHKIIEKEIRYVKRAPVYRHHAPAPHVRVQTVLVPIVQQAPCGCPCTCGGGSHGGYAQAYTQTYVYAEPRAYARPSTQYVLVPVQQSGGYAYAYAYR
jgi:hypothetical protein